MSHKWLVKFKAKNGQFYEKIVDAKDRELASFRAWHDLGTTHNVVMGEPLSIEKIKQGKQS